MPRNWSRSTATAGATPASPPEAVRVYRAKDLDELSRMAAGHLVTAVQRTKGPFSVVLSGGSTPRRLHELLAAEPYRSLMPWDRLNVFFGDERCVPPEHKDSNFAMAKSTLLARAPIPAEQVFRMRGEDVPPEAALAYEADLKAFFRGRPPAFDWVFLGLGDDGHTASLFPGSPALEEKSRPVVSNRVEKLNADRLTLTYPVLNAAKVVCFLVSGEAKAPVLKRILEEGGASGFPAAGVRPATGDLRWYVDQPAARLLKP